MLIDTMNIRTLEGVSLIRLTGTREERAIQAGRIVASLTPEERNTLAIRPLAKRNQTLIRKALARKAGMGKLLDTLYETYVSRLARRLPGEHKRLLKAFSHAANLREKDVLLALYQPDLLMVLAGLNGEEARNHFLAGMPGCSTITSSASPNGMLFARNLDYPAASTWEKWPAVYYHEPSEGGSLKYVSVSSLGILLSGLTGWNEMGVGLSLHAHFSKKTNSKGHPVFFLGESILEKARTLEEAIYFCKKFSPIGSWALNLVSFREKKAAVVELSQGKIHVRELSDSHFIAHSNHFQNPEFRESEIYFNGAFYEDVKSRKFMLEELLGKLQNPSPLDAANALSSHQDGVTGELRVGGNTVSLVTTIQSMIAVPDEDGFYLSIRKETPTPLGPFLKLPFRWEGLPEEGAVPEILKSTHDYSENFLKALHHYHEAYVAWQVAPETSKSSEVTHALLIEATDALPEDPHLWMQRGYFELIHDQKKTGLECFTTALSLRMSPHLSQVARYFQGVCLDLLGDRAGAIQHYEAVYATALDPKLKKKARTRVKKPYLTRYCQKLSPDLQFIEPIYYS